ncbi:MAG: hypothetical protein EXQ69_08755 [Acidimicrobiia bacterium]|nr:hypothetical protein [Acidimicrobiia bacterium]
MSARPAADEAPIAIIGSGVSGLAAARELMHLGFDATVYESSNQIGGMADTQRDPDGFIFDTGAHFITNRFATAIGIAPLCRTVHRYGETVWSDGRAYDYPFGLMRNPRYLRGAINARIRSKRSVETAADQFRSEYGSEIADEVALPLLEQWSGLPADRLSPAVADKLPGGILATLALKLSARATNRAVAIGYCREAPQSANVWHVYPENGIATICAALTTELGDAVQTGNPVERVLTTDGRAVGVVVNGREIPAAAVISTLPVPHLAALTDEESLQPFRELRYRAMVFVNIMLRGCDVMPDTLTWTPGVEFPCFRISETTRSMPWLAPTGSTIITADFGATVGDSTWTEDDQVLEEMVLKALCAIVPSARRDFLGSRVLRSAFAYPIFDLAYEETRLALGRGTGIERLLSVGRNGEFAHILMEDSYWRTLRQVRALAAQLNESVQN